jgi:hypothetical protein
MMENIVYMDTTHNGHDAGAYNARQPQPRPQKQKRQGLSGVVGVVVVCRSLLSQIADADVDVGS